MSRTIVDVHILQTVPPSNVNRDDTGSPKTAVFGGVRRARVSSQAWKRAARLAFSDLLDRSELGTRTKRVVEVVAERVKDLRPDLESQAGELAYDIVAATGLKLEKVKRSKAGSETENAETGYLVFLSQLQIDRLAEVAIEVAEEADRAAALKARNVKSLLETDHSVDVALFGRMIADDRDLRVDACAQVAHAISVHAVDNEYDYFTAVDDLSNETGAGHLGETEFAASVFYKYAVCNYPQLVGNLAGDRALAARGLKALAQAMARAVPIGKKNGTAPHNPADYIEVIVRRDAPVSLANAFLRPVRPQGEKDVMDVSIERLREQAKKYASAYGDEHVVERFVLDLRGTGNVATLNDLAKKLEAKLIEVGGA